MSSILILDDVGAEVFFLRRIIQKLNPDSEIHSYRYAEDALSFLRSPDRIKFDLLLVDINMPRMNGFEFVDAYQELYSELRGSALVYVMSSSLNPDDQSRAEMHPAVNGYLTKPVSKDQLKEILSTDA